MTVTIDLVTLNDTFDEWRTRTNQLINVVNDIEANTNLVNFISNTSSITITPQTGRGGFVRINANVVNRANDTSTINIASAAIVNTIYNAVITLDNRANSATQNISNTGTAANAYSDIVGAGGNNYTRTLTTAANNWANTVAVVANNYADVASAGGNNYTRTVGTAGNNYTNTVGTAGNNYTNAVGAAGNNYTNTVGTAGNNYTNTVGTAGNNFSIAITTVGNNYANLIGTRSNSWANLVGLAANSYSLALNQAAATYANEVGAGANNFSIAIATVGNNYANLIGTRSNSWANLVGTAANSYTVVVGTAGNNYTNTVGTAGNNYTNTVGTAGNNYTNAVGAAGNNYMIVVTSVGNNYANLIGTRSNSWANSIVVVANNYAGLMANASNGLASTAQTRADDAHTRIDNLVLTSGSNTAILADSLLYANAMAISARYEANVARQTANAAFGVANNALSNTSGSSFNGNLIFPSGNIGIGTAVVPTKSIDIYAEDTETFVGTGSISGNVLTITAVTFGTVANGAYIASEAYLGELGTYIVGYRTGAGGIGTYFISHPQEVASSTIRASSLNRNSIRIMKNDDTIYSGQILGAIEFATNDTSVSGKETTRAFVAAQVEDTDASAALVFGTGFVGNSSLTANSATEQLRINSKGAVSFNSAGYGVTGQILESRGTTSSPVWRQDLAFDKANSANLLAFNTGLGSNAFASATIAGANLSFQNTIAGANAAVGGGANNFASATIAGANVITNLAFDKANSANLLAFQVGGAVSALNVVSAIQNVAFDKANSANLLAFAALPKTGGTITGDLVVSGNLTISGNTTYSNTQTLLIGDNIFVLNADVPVSSAPSENAGMIVNRGSSANAEIIWDETADTWTMSRGDGVYVKIAANTDIEATAAFSNTSGSSYNGSFNIPTGNLAVGTTNPTMRLQVVAPTGLTAFGAYGAGGNITVDYNGLSQNFYEANTHYFKGGYPNNPERMRIDASGNVGIGTSSPLHKLDVRGTLRVRNESGGSNANIYVSDGSTSMAMGIWGSSTDAYIGTTSSDALYIRTSDTDRVRIGSTGGMTSYGSYEINVAAQNADFYLNSVGGSGRRWLLNSTTSGNFSVYDMTSTNTRLSISGSGAVRMQTANGNTTHEFASSSARDTNYITIRNPAGYSALTLYSDVNGHSGIASYEGGNLYIVNTSPNDPDIIFQIGPAYTEYMRIANNACVGIGTNTPTSNIHVIGTGNITSSLVVGTLNVAPTIQNAYDKANAANVLAFSYSNVYSTIAGANAATVGQQTIFVPAGAMTARATSGAASGSLETATNKVMLQSYDFDTTTQEFVQFAVQMPKSWNEGTLICQFIWSHAATTTNFGVVWQIQAVALSDTNAGDTAFGTAVTATDTGGTTNALYISPETAALTVGNTPAAEDYVIFQISRSPADASDTMAIDARLHGVKIHYTTDTARDD